MTTLAADEGTSPLVLVLAIAMGILSWWQGRRTWRGEELAWIERQEREQGTPYRSLCGARRQYQSFTGSAHAGMLIGPGFALMAASEVLRSILGQERDWWLFLVVWVVGMSLVSVGVLYLFAYFWVGVPDRLRPPCQRGWEIVDGELQLVRPEAFHEHPKHRSSQGDQPSGYDPWR